MPITIEEKQKILRDNGFQPWEADVHEVPGTDEVDIVPLKTEQRGALNVGARAAADAAARGVQSFATTAALATAGAPLGPYGAAAGGLAGLGLDLFMPNVGQKVVGLFDGRDEATRKAQEMRDAAEHPYATAVGTGAGMLSTARPSISGLASMKNAAQALRRGEDVVKNVMELAPPAIGAVTAAREIKDNPAAFDPTTGPGLANIAPLVLGLASTKSTALGRAGETLGRGTVELIPGMKPKPPPTTPNDTLPGQRFEPNISTTDRAPEGPVFTGGVLTGNQNEKLPFYQQPEGPNLGVELGSPYTAAPPAPTAEKKQPFVVTSSGVAIEPQFQADPIARLRQLAKQREIETGSTGPNKDAELLIKQTQSEQQGALAKKQAKALTAEEKRLLEEREAAKDFVAEEQSLMDQLTAQRAEERNANAEHARTFAAMLSGEDEILKRAIKSGMTKEEAAAFAKELLSPADPNKPAGLYFTDNPAIKKIAQDVLQSYMDNQPEFQPRGTPEVGKPMEKPLVPNPDYNAPPLEGGSRRLTPPESSPFVAEPTRPSSALAELQGVRPAAPIDRPIEPQPQRLTSNVTLAPTEPQFTVGRPKAVLPQGAATMLPEGKSGRSFIQDKNTIAPRLPEGEVRQSGIAVPGDVIGAEYANKIGGINSDPQLSELVGRSKTANDLLSELAKEKDSPYAPLAEALHQEISAIVSGHRISRSTGNESYAQGKRIVLGKTANRATAIHELLHGATQSYINKHAGGIDTIESTGESYRKQLEMIAAEPKTPGPIRDLISLYFEAATPYSRELFEQNGSANRKANEQLLPWYGLKNLHEFISESWTNKDFIRYLSERRTVGPDNKPTTLWEKFKSIISNIFPSLKQHRTLYDDVMENSLSIIKDSARSAQERTATQRDTAYMQAVKSGDMATAQRLVDEAAREAGYTIAYDYGVDGIERKLVNAVHSTPNEFDVFDKKRIGSNTDNGYYGKGFYFSLRSGGDSYGKNKIQAYLRLEKPFTGDIGDIAVEAGVSKDGSFDVSIPGVSDAITNKLIELGYDGVKANAEVVVFNPNQIKRSDPITYDKQGNVIPLSERFNRNTDNINYANSQQSPMEIVRGRTSRPITQVPEGGSGEVLGPAGTYRGQAEQGGGPPAAQEGKAAPEGVQGELAHIPGSLISSVSKLPIPGAKELAQSLEHFLGGVRKMEGIFWNVQHAALSKLPKQDIVDVWNARREATILGMTEPLTGLSGVKAKIYNLISSTMDAIRERNNSIAGEETGRRPMGHNSNYVPDLFSPSAIDATHDYTARQKMRQEFIDYNEQIAQRRGEEFDPAEAGDYFDKYTYAARSGEGMGEFNALVKAAREYFIPDSMREMNPLEAMQRYTKRAAMDLSRAVFVEPIKRNRELLGIRKEGETEFNGQDSAHKTLEAARHQLYGTKSDAQTSTAGRLFHAAQNIVYGGAMQTYTGVHNLLDGIARAKAAGASLAQILKSNTIALAEWSRLQESAQRHGATSVRVADIRTGDQMASATSQVMEVSKRIRDTLSKMTFGQTLENASRVRDFALGEMLAKEAIRTGDKEFFKKFGAGIEAGASEADVIGQAAANFVTHLQGGYNMSDLPAFMINNSTTAQLMRLHRYGWGAMNRLYLDTIVPAKRGNLFPLMSYLAAAWGVGELKKEMRKQLTGLPSSNLTLAETKELTNGNDLELALTIAEGADNAGYFGLLGSILAAGAKGVRGKKTSVFVDPAVDYVWNGIMVNAAQTVSEAKDGTDIARILANFFKRATIDAMQNGRLVESMLMSNEEKVLKAASQTRLAAEGVSPVNERGGAERAMQNIFPNLSPDARPHALRSGLIKGEDWAWRQFYKLAETDPLRAQKIQRELKPQAPFYAGNSPAAGINNQLLTTLLQRRGLFQPTLDAIQARGEGMSNAAQRAAPLP